LNAGSSAPKAPTGSEQSDAAQTDTVDTVLLSALEKELHRGQVELGKQDPAPYFTSYNITDGETLVVMASQGGILTASRSRQRVADVSMRIGKPDLDNTHGADRGSGITSGNLPVQDDPDAIARTLFPGDNHAGRYVSNLDAIIVENAIPEPSALTLFGAALFALGAMRRRFNTVVPNRS